MWKKHNIYEVARPEAIELTPKKFFDFQNKKALMFKDKKPNVAHKKLVDLEDVFNVFIITQNIDDLHEKAGSDYVLHIHGVAREAICHKCQKEVRFEDGIYGKQCSNCAGGLIRPKLVLFKERPFYMAQITRLLKEADLFIQIGTSGEVYPAADFVRQVSCPTINISLDKPENNDLFTYSFLGKATNVVPKVVSNLLKK